MDKKILEQAKKLVQKDNTKHNQEIVKENNQPVREYTKAEKMVFAIAKDNLDLLDQALKNCIYSELDAAEIIKDAQPVGDDFDKYYRIVQVISRYDGAWKANQYEGRAPSAKISLIEPIKPVNKLK